jgi:DNA-binding GntR family transcriptional regulator
MEESDRIMHMGLSAKPHQDPIPRFGQAHEEIIAAIQERNKRVALALIAGHIEGSRDRALRALRAQPIVM